MVSKQPRRISRITQTSAETRKSTQHKNRGLESNTKLGSNMSFVGAIFLIRCVLSDVRKTDCKQEREKVPNMDCHKRSNRFWRF